MRNNLGQQLGLIKVIGLGPIFIEFSYKKICSGIGYALLLCNSKTEHVSPGMGKIRFTGRVYVHTVGDFMSF